ncbi:hypothetical protein OG711_38715 (plasmid) [Streptomyces uncialis]|uniref:hypothetical protein n=1 Tax=Streptomyces uncialis TaxID=1048205 RepID=UPI002E35B374|nr:hypothetical protein [Streptomyces uncialis]
MEREHPARRFGPGFVEEQRRRFGPRLPEGRQLTYDLAVEEEYEPWRIWLDEQLALLPDKTADTFAANLWQDQNFWPYLIELAAGAALRAAGSEVQFERAWAGQTPDWTVTDEHGTPIALVEVLTHSPPKDTFGKMKAWHNLVERLKQIPVPVVLTVAGDSSRPLPAPDARTAKKITQDLRRALLSPPHQTVHRSQGYTFLVQAGRGNGQTMQPPGMRTILVPPSNIAGIVSARPLAAGIDRKVSKYRALARESGLPLIVAAGAHKFTGLTVRQLDDLLTGTPTMTVQFNFGDSFIHEPVSFQPGAPPRWSMPPDLAGVLWVDNVFPFTTRWRPNQATAAPAPPGLAVNWN